MIEQKQEEIETQIVDSRHKTAQDLLKTSIYDQAVTDVTNALIWRTRWQKIIIIFGGSV